MTISLAQDIPCVVTLGCIAWVLENIGLDEPGTAFKGEMEDLSLVVEESFLRTSKNKILQ